MVKLMPVDRCGPCGLSGDTDEESGHYMKRIIELDIFKAMAAIMVILIHVTATPVVSLQAGAAAEVLVAVNRFAKPSVPMFIFASGLSLYYIYSRKEFHYGEFIRKRLMKILAPYLFWCAVYYAYYVSNGIYQLSPEIFLRYTVSGKMIYHLYFVVIIIQFYLLFGIFNQLTKRVGGAAALFVGFALNLLAIQYLPVEYMGRCFLTYLTYFLLGCYFGKNIEAAAARLIRFRYAAGAAFLAAGLLYTIQFYEAEVLGIGYRFLPDAFAFLIFSAAACMFYYFCAIRFTQMSGSAAEADSGLLPMARRALLLVSDGSYYIYLSHPLAIIAAGAISARLGVAGVIDQMLLALAVIFTTSVPLSIAYAGWRASRGRSDRRMGSGANV